MNREDWLTEVARRLEPMFRRKGYYSKAYRVTCGWPCTRAVSTSRRRVGECHPPERSDGNVYEVFVSPTVADSVEVAGIVCHELIHASVGVECGHEGAFRLACKHLEMKGKPTQAVPGGKMLAEVERIVRELGVYPHYKVEVPRRAAARQEPPVRLECAKCGCRVTISRKWLADAGHPTCGCGGEME